MEKFPFGGGTCVLTEMVMGVSLKPPRTRGDQPYRITPKYLPFLPRWDPEFDSRDIATIS